MCLKNIYWISQRVKDFHWAWNVIFFASAVPRQATCAVLAGRGTVLPGLSCGLTGRGSHLFSGFVRILSVPSAKVFLIVSIFQVYFKSDQLTQTFWADCSFRNVCAISPLGAIPSSDQWCPWHHAAAHSSLQLSDQLSTAQKETLPAIQLSNTKKHIPRPDRQHPNS